MWGPALAVLAALTMTVGNLVALRQRHAVRLLAWSSVAQAGYMLVPLGAAGGRRTSTTCCRRRSPTCWPTRVMNLGAFAVVDAGRRGTGRPTGSPTTAALGAHRAADGVRAGVLRWPAWPGCRRACSGLFAKVVVFRAPVDQGVGWLAVVMAVNVVIGLVLLPGLGGLARTPGTDPAAPRPPSYRISWSDGLAIGITLGAALVALGGARRWCCGFG